nr:hypothetical protein [Desulfobacula sp.]
MNPDYVAASDLGPERIDLTTGSSIITAGEQVDNYTPYIMESGEIRPDGLTKGGSITLRERTIHGEGVVLAEGSELDVSGGYIIDENRRIVKAGDAGELTLLGPAVILKGDIKGYSAPGKKGGSFKAHALQTDVIQGTGPDLPEGYSTETSLPEELKNRMVIDGGFFEQTGFSRISLSAVTDLKVHEPVSLEPSRMKTLLASKGTKTRYEAVDLQDIGASSITLTAGTLEGFSKFYTLDGETPLDGNDPRVRNASLCVGKNVNLETSPEGQISLTGPSVDLAGRFSAPAGKITVTSNNSFDLYPLTVRSTARFFAGGFNRITNDIIGEEFVMEPLDGGEVTFSSAGKLVMEQGSVVDVSGSTPVTLYRMGPNGKPTAYGAASEPGSISLSFARDMDDNHNTYLNSRFLAQKHLSYLRGGFFSLSKTDSLNDLMIDPEMMKQIEADGFDKLSLAGESGITFEHSLTVNMARGISIDAPVLTGTGTEIITLKSTQVSLCNTDTIVSTGASSGRATLTVETDYLDMDGDIRAAGFSDIHLSALQDIRLSDQYYQSGSINEWRGGFATDGDLTLTAARIYPETDAWFTFASEGTIRVLPSGITRTDPIYSALGQLTLQAENIEHKGVLAAPLGQIHLIATAKSDAGDRVTGRVYLSDDSILSVSGSPYAAINYGAVSDQNGKWYKTGKSAGTEITSLPEKTVDISASEVIGRDKAVIDIGGGGTLFGYTFIPGIEGSLNPLSASNRYVVLPASMGILHGDGIFLEDNIMIGGGLYTLVPDEYAFINGAMILEDMGSVDPSLPVSRSNDGYATAIGYEMSGGTGGHSSSARLYAIREASDVLKEGQYQFQKIDAGSAGSLTVNAGTNIFSSRVLASALDKTSRSGIITMGGKDVIFNSTTVALAPDFNFNTLLDKASGMVGKLFLDAEKLAQSGLWELNIGKENLTQTITLENGSILKGTRINLIADKDIQLEQGAGILGTGENGSVNVFSGEGSLIMADTSFIRSSGSIGIDAEGLDRKGEIRAEKAISFLSDHLYLTDTDHEAGLRSFLGTTGGMVVDEALWKSFGALEEISLVGRSTLGLAGNVALIAEKAVLLVDTPLLNYIADNEGTSLFKVRETYLMNTRDGWTGTGKDVKPGHLIVDADRISIGYGNVSMSGLSDIALNSKGNLTFIGKGKLDTGNGNLNIAAAGTTGQYRWYFDEETQDYTYEALDYGIDAGTGKISIAHREDTDTTREKNDNIGGKLSFSASSIENSGYIGLTSGVIHFNATGSGDDKGLFMKKGSEVSVKGTMTADNTVFDGGMVYYEAKDDTIHLTGSVTDVSSGSATGNAGTIAIYNPNGLLSVSEAVFTADRGGNFLLDTKSLSESDTLFGILGNAGFDSRIDMRVRTGDVSLASDVTAREFRLSVDQGNVAVNAAINASGTAGGGRVEIYAGGNLTLSSGTQIDAKGLGSFTDGGEVILGSGISSSGFMDLSGATIDVASFGGTGGSIYFRVPRTADGSDLRLDMDATLLGASRVTVEGAKLYQTSTINDAYLTAIQSETATFMNTYGTAIKNRLLLEIKNSETINKLSISPGIEIQSAGNLELSAAKANNLKSWRFGQDLEPAVLTLRAAGNLTINQDMLDNPTPSASLMKNTAPTTSLNLSAGATLASADPFAVEKGVGNLSLADGKMIYTEGGDINFASGNTTTLQKPPTSTSKDYMTKLGKMYSLGSYTGNVRGRTGGDLTLSGGVIQTATGDIDLDVGGELKLGWTVSSGVTYTGTIRTTGQPLSVEESGVSNEKDRQRIMSAYNGGGDIRIRAAGDIRLQSALGESDMSFINSSAWDTKSKELDLSKPIPYPTKTLSGWSARYEGTTATQGIVTMGEGNIDIDTQGDFFSATGTFGKGDLSILARGDIDGRFLNKKGNIDIQSLSNIGTLSSGQVVEAFDSQISLNAQGNITMAGVLNPTITSNNFSSSYQWDLRYTEQASLSMKAAKGSITLTGSPDTELKLIPSDYKKFTILPPSLELIAGEDIRLGAVFYLPPSADGRLTLYAGNDILGGGIYMSDADPADVYGVKTTSDQSALNWTNLFNLHADTPVHLKNDSRVIVEAGRDIRDVQLTLPKMAMIQAGRDIVDISLVGQNLRAGDTTIIDAGRNILFQAEKIATSIERGIILSGPGLTLVHAGDSIDLGSSLGIQSLGQSSNPALDAGKNDLIVLAGTKKSFSVAELDNFFVGHWTSLNQAGIFEDLGFVPGTDGLRGAGVKWTKAHEIGNDLLAQQIIEDARKYLISPLFEGSEGVAGNISLMNSKIFTSGGAGSIYTLAKGKIDVGLSSITPPPITGQTEPEKKNSGFYTTAGGSISIYAGLDINVNESRVMTFSGGDIDILSDYRNLNAGRGDKASVASTRSYKVKQSDGSFKTVFEVPAVGSGIRATAPRAENAGDIYATAWEGDIDAGEAGIAGRNVTLAAKRVLNAQNIQATGFSLGFTKPAEASGSLTGLSGGGGLADAGLMSEESSALAGARDRMNEEEPEGYSYEPKWVDVQVIGFEEENNDDA